MTVDKDDRVLAQLRKLREGAGLTVARLANAGFVMGALATSDPQEAHARLLTLIKHLPETDQTRAMRLDYGIGVAELLGRPAVPREMSYLGDRRNAYKQVVDRDVKTLSRWSDATIRELRAALLTDQVEGDLVVAALVDATHVIAVNVTVVNDATRHTTTTIDNNTNGASPPLLVYALPRDWSPKSLTLAAIFRSSVAPGSGYAYSTDSFPGVSFGQDRYELRRQEDSLSCKFVHPRRDRIYVLVWG